MFKNLAKATLIFTASILTFHSAFANAVQDTHKEKYYLVRITSTDPSNSVNFAGAMVQILNGIAAPTLIDSNATPFEGKVSSKFVNLMVHTVSPTSPEIKVEIIEQVEGKDNLLISGSGHAVFVHEDEQKGGYTNAV